MKNAVVTLDKVTNTFTVVEVNTDTAASKVVFSCSLNDPSDPRERTFLLSNAHRILAAQGYEQVSRVTDQDYIQMLYRLDERVRPATNVNSL